MNLKKTIIIGLAVMAVFSSFGCGDSGKQGSSSSSASVSTQQKKPLDEATIKALLKKMESSNIAEKKEACPVEKMAGYRLLKTPLMEPGVKIQDYYNQTFTFSNLSISEIKQDDDFASARLSYTTNDKKSYNGVYHFVRMNGKWCVDLTDIKIAKPLNISGYDTSQLDVATNIGYTYENDIIIAFAVRSKTTTNYTLGQWSQPSYVLITDKGEFPAQNTEGISGPTGFFQITSAQPISLYIPFKAATGKPKALRIIGFNEMDSQGFPVGNNTAQVVTFTLSE